MLVFGLFGNSTTQMVVRRPPLISSEVRRKSGRIFHWPLMIEQYHYDFRLQHIN